MARLKVVLLLGISYAVLLNQGSTVTVLSPSPSLEIFFQPLSQDATNQSTASTTIAPTISERIHASLNNVLRIPLPLWGSVAVPGTGSPTPSQTHQQQQSLSHAPQVIIGGNVIPEQHREQTDQQNRLGQEKQPQQIGVFRNPMEVQAAPPPQSSFLPIPVVNQAIHSTIAQLTTLSHWPFGYGTTNKPQQQQQQQLVQATAPIVKQPPTQPSTQQTTTTTPMPPSSTTTVATTTAGPTVQAFTTASSASMPAPPQLLPPSPTQAMTPSQQTQTFPSFVSSSGTIFPYPPAQSAPVKATPSPSLPDRIHNRIQSVHSTIHNYIRLPNLSQIGQPRPRPMLTEPPWVTELLGPTLEPPTTRAPTLGERVHNSIQNVLLFVPATLLNFWYQNWGTRHVDMFIQRLQLSTPRPGSASVPIFATDPQHGPNPFANFTLDSLSANNGSSSAEFPAIAAFINNNGTVSPTIVHPVVNMTANTIEYLLRGENETTVLWTGTLSNDVFFGNRKTVAEVQLADIEDDEEEEEQKIKHFVLNIKEE